jgi:hypothetical protein
MLNHNLIHISIDKLNKKPRCKYGKECRTQTNIGHATKYKHWFKKNIADTLHNSVKDLLGNPLSEHNESDDDDYKSEDIENTDNDMETDEEDEDAMDTDDN